MKSDWDEVKRLAADFQKAQLNTTLQKLSDRNCVEIVSWLTKEKMLDVIFTLDGKEYITPKYLSEEIQGELFVCGGRLNLDETAKTINVDLVHVNKCAHELARDKDVHLVLGQLVSSTYLERLSVEIGEKLRQTGQLSISDLSLQFDLPTDFLQKHIIDRHLKVIRDPDDSQLLYTEEFVRRLRGCLRGALCALTKPCSLATVAATLGVGERLAETFLEPGCAAGSFTGKGAAAQFVPQIYTRSQVAWVTSFYRQNGYLEFEGLRRVGISDAKGYLRRHPLPDATLIWLSSCVVGDGLLARLDADVDECVRTGGHVDLQTSLPTILDLEDIQQLVERSRQRAKVHLVPGALLLVSTAMLDRLVAECDSLAQEAAAVAVESGAFQQAQMGGGRSGQGGGASAASEPEVSRRDERRRKAAGGKSGGGTQGRETKTKSTKKHPVRKGRRKNSSTSSADAEGDAMSFKLIRSDDVLSVIAPLLNEEGLEHAAEEVSALLLERIEALSRSKAEQQLATLVADSSNSRRQAHAAFQDQVLQLHGDVRQFERALKHFTAETASQLDKYLVRTVCAEAAALMLNYLTVEAGLGAQPLPAEGGSLEQRLKMAGELPDAATKAAMLELVRATTADAFCKAADAGLECCGVVVRKQDRRRDRQAVAAIRAALLDRLDATVDPAAVLHLAVVALFSSVTGCALHAAGKHVGAVIQFLGRHLSTGQVLVLQSYHDLVTAHLSNTQGKNIDQLMEKMDSVKKLAVEYKKSQSTSEEA